VNAVNRISFPPGSTFSLSILHCFPAQINGAPLAFYPTHQKIPSNPVQQSSGVACMKIIRPVYQAKSTGGNSF
jgi:hypothetical protein